MPRYEALSKVTIREGILSDEPRQVTNYAATDGPQNDQAAEMAGFKGAVVSGFIHNEQLRCHGVVWALVT
jgi:hypothetical protein